MDLSCPECGTPGEPDSRTTLRHCNTPGQCHVYTWSHRGQVIARDVNSKADRDARADAFDARIRSLNPFRRSR